MSEPPFRTGRRNARNLYKQLGDEPSTADQPIGMLDTPEIARFAVAAMNAHGTATSVEGAVEQLLKLAESIWGHRTWRMDLAQVTIALGVVAGDINRAARDSQEGRAVNGAEVRKELGNLILSAVRWCAELGYSPAEAVEAAAEAQRRYVQGRAATG